MNSCPMLPNQIIKFPKPIKYFINLRKFICKIAGHKQIIAPVIVNKFSKNREDNQSHLTQFVKYTICCKRCGIRLEKIEPIPGVYI